VVAAALAVARVEAARRQRRPPGPAAQVDGGRHRVALRGTGGTGVARERLLHAQVQPGGRHLDGVAGHGPEVERVQPAAVGHRSVVAGHPVAVDAGVPGLVEVRVGHLQEPDRARGGRVHAERIEGEAPPPVGAGQRVARALNLDQRRQELGPDEVGRALLEERAVTGPGLLRGERVGREDQPQQLGGLPHHLHQEIHQEEEDQPDEDPGQRREPGQPRPQVPRPPARRDGPSPAGAGRDAAPARAALASHRVMIPRSPRPGPRGAAGRRRFPFRPPRGRAIGSDPEVA
jgi:hypothetical protein